MNNSFTRFLPRYNIEMNVQLHAPSALPPERVHYPLDRSLGGPHRQTERGGPQKKSLVLSRDRALVIQSFASPLF